MKALAPGYYKAFKCSGGSCPDDCCHNMLINVDEETYAKYRSQEDIAFRKRLMKNIEVKSTQPFKASIKLSKNGYCNFFGKDGLCEIQAKCGHEALSYACRTYPRMFCDAGGELETYISMGCEAAARQALFSEETMRLDEVQLDCDIRYKNVLYPEKYYAGEHALDMFRNLRNISVHILQLRKYRLWFRVVMLGLLMQRIDSLLTQGNEDEIYSLAAEYTASLDDVDYNSYKDVIPERLDIKIIRIYSFFETIANYRSDKKHDALNECIGQVKDGLGIVSLEQPVQEIAACFANARDAYYAPFFESREHIMENYMVNTVLSTGFPFSYRKENSVYGNYVRLATRYSMIKFLLTGMAGYHKEDFSEDAAVRAIASFSRFFDHDKEITDAVIDSFNLNMPVDMKSVCILLKD